MKFEPIFLNYASNKLPPTKFFLVLKKPAVFLIIIQLKKNVKILKIITLIKLR